jgi:glycosyltransferase involved in cell wall biosynthesis
MMHMAEAFAHAGGLRAYIAPFAPTHAELAASPWRRLGPVGRPVLSQLRRRVVSEQVGRSERLGAARTADAAASMALRLSLRPPLIERLNEWRNQAIQHRAAELISADDTDVLVPAGAALKPLVRARRLGVRGWLDCPTAHHRWAESLLREEQRLQPAFAATMQFPASSERVARRLDLEIEQADELIMLSSFQRRTFEERGVDPSRIHLVPLGVDVELFRPLPRPQDGPFTIGFVGQVTQRKGISYVIDAFESVRDRGVRLLVVGRPVGPRRPWMRPGIEHHLPVARSNLPTLYARMDVVVLPSLIEGFGLTALEAMSCGVPVIVSENTFGRDIVVDGANGYVVPIRDANAISERIRSLADEDQLRITLGANARATAIRYAWDTFGARIVDLVTNR